MDGRELWPIFWPVAGMPPRSDYVLRHGGRYDRDLVHFVEQWASSGVMVFKQAEAEALWECALEGDKITERERDTLKYVLDRYEFEPSAKMWLQLLADPPPSSTAPTFVVHGVEVVTKLWDEALKFTQDGTLDVVEARDLWAMASPDEETCPPLEASTLRLVLAQMHSSPNAYKFLIGKLGGEEETAPAPPPKPVVVAPPPPKSPQKPAAPALAPKPASPNKSPPSPPPEPVAPPPPPPRSEPEPEPVPEPKVEETSSPDSQPEPKQLSFVETVEAATSPVVEYLGTMFGIHSNTLYEEDVKEPSGHQPKEGEPGHKRTRSNLSLPPITPRHEREISQAASTGVTDSPMAPSVVSAPPMELPRNPNAYAGGPWKKSPGVAAILGFGTLNKTPVPSKPKRTISPPQNLQRPENSENPYAGGPWKKSPGCLGGGCSGSSSKGGGGSGGDHLEKGFLGISYANWGYLGGCLITLYLFLGLYYWALMTIAYDCRGSEYMRLPSRFFGNFDRDHYFPGYGAPINDGKVMLYPWVQQHYCPENLPNRYVCDPECENLIFHAYKCNSECETKCELF